MVQFNFTHIKAELQDPIKKIDLKPLYQCILIHEFLGEKEILKIDFEKSRKHHAELLLNLQVSIASNGNLKYVEDFIQEVVGYFMIESIVMSSTESFRSRGVVESIWESIMDKMNEIIASTLKTTSDTKVFLGLKNLIVNFMQSIEMYGYSVIKLSDSMSNLYDSFTELMKSECTEKITQVFRISFCSIQFKAVEDDSLVPLIVNNQEEYLALCLHFKFTDDKKIIGTRYPKTLSCTNGFIVCCQLIKKFIFEFYKFAEGFKQQNNEMDDLLKKVNIYQAFPFSTD